MGERWRAVSNEIRGNLLLGAEIVTFYQNSNCSFTKHVPPIEEMIRGVLNQLRHR